jgi:3-hydroxybutyryl-CoA dehydrogenase
MRASGIRRIAVIGAGLMGHGTALEFAAHGYDIRLHDREQTQRARARDSIAEGLGRLVEIGRITSATAAATPDHITLSTDLRSTVANADLVIESVFEDLDVKRDVFRDLDCVTPPHVILASNTSTFLPSLLAVATRRPDRVLAAHYFYPPYLLPLVELVRGKQTSDVTVATMSALYRAIGKRPAVVKKEAPGFVANRLQMAFFREAFPSWPLASPVRKMSTSLSRLASGANLDLLVPSSSLIPVDSTSSSLSASNSSR